MSAGPLSGRIVLVTGATRGLGYAVAVAMAARGAHVVALARTVGGLEELDDAIAATPGAVTLAPLDITDDQGLERLGAAIHQRWGRLDGLVHCAAEGSPLSPAEHVAQKDIDKALAVNARSTQRLIRIADPLLRAAPAAQAVFITDDGAVGQKFNAAYGASKAAATAIARSYAEETRRASVSVWFAAPPPMPTALRARAHPGENPDRLTKCAAVAERIVARFAAGEMAQGDSLRCAS